MSSRPDYTIFTKTMPEAYSGLGSLSKSVDAAGQDKALTELVKLRASQINGCAFCLQYHLTLARKLGVSEHKLDLLAAWHDAGIFSERERAALAWTETLTRLGAGQGASDAAWAELREQFSESEAMALTVAVATINAWNRIGVGLSFAPVIPSARAGA